MTAVLAVVLVLAASAAFVTIYIRRFAARSLHQQAVRQVPLETLPSLRANTRWYSRFDLWHEPFRLISVADAFEPDTAPLWETLVPVLDWIRVEQSVEIVDLLPAYEQAARQYPELYEGSSFEGWVRMLEESELICRTNESAVITERGIEFLRCRVPAGASVR